MITFVTPSSITKSRRKRGKTSISVLTLFLQGQHSTHVLSSAICSCRPVVKCNQYQWKWYLLFKGSLELPAQQFFVVQHILVLGFLTTIWFAGVSVSTFTECLFLIFCEKIAFIFTPFGVCT